MGWFSTWNWSTFDNMRYGFKRYGKVDPIRIKCKNCGYVLQFIYHKKQICPMCNNYVYPDGKEEFREKLKKEIKKNEKN